MLSAPSGVLLDRSEFAWAAVSVLWGALDTFDVLWRRQDSSSVLRRGSEGLRHEEGRPRTAVGPGLLGWCSAAGGDVLLITEVENEECAVCKLVDPVRDDADAVVGDAQNGAEQEQRAGGEGAGVSALGAPDFNGVLALGNPMEGKLILALLIEDEPFRDCLGGADQGGCGPGVGVEVAPAVEAEHRVEGVEPELVGVKGVGGLRTGSLLYGNSLMY